MDSMEVLQCIIAADKAARDRYETAKCQLESADSRADTLRRDMTEQKLTQARKEVEEERQRLLKDADAEAQQLDEACRQQLAGMRQKFEAQKDVFAEKMFRMAVGLE